MSPLKEKIDLLGSIAGVLGMAFCLLAVVLRLVAGAGNPTGIIVAPRNILLGGIALLACGCFLKLSSR